MPADHSRSLLRPCTGPLSWPSTLRLVLVLVTARWAGAQPPPPSDGSYGDFSSANFNPSLAIIIAVVVAFFFIMGFFSLYLRGCGDVSATVAAAAASTVRRPASPRGLDPAVLAAIPTLMYADVKLLKAGDGALECAVCLCEFDDKEFLRMLPRCCHVFHLDCIDTWLESHVTCPVCRADVALAAAAADDDDTKPEHVSVDVAVAEEAAELARMASRKRARRLARSHTTGRAVWVRPGDGGMDRCTLRLPENVRRELVEGKGLRRAASCAGSGSLFPREESSRSGYRVGSMRVMWAAAPRFLRTSSAPRFLRTSSAPRFLRTSSARASSSGTGGGLLDCLVGGGQASSTVNVGDDDESTVEISHV